MTYIKRVWKIYFSKDMLIKKGCF